MVKTKVKKAQLKNTQFYDFFSGPKFSNFKIFWVWRSNFDRMIFTMFFFKLSFESEIIFTSSHASHLGLIVSAWCLPQYSRPSPKKYSRSTKSSEQLEQLKHSGCHAALWPARWAVTIRSPGEIGFEHWRKML